MSGIDSEFLRYEGWQKRQCDSWENLCTRCGACCGLAEGDPCEHLTKTDHGRYACRIYENRLGLHKTVSGREFLCVPIRQVLDKSWPGDQCCGYKKNHQFNQTSLGRR